MTASLCCSGCALSFLMFQRGHFPDQPVIKHMAMLACCAAIVRITSDSAVTVVTSQHKIAKNVALQVDAGRATVLRQLAVLDEGRFVDSRTDTVDMWTVTYNRASSTFSLITVVVERQYDGTFAQTVRVVSAEDTGVFLALSRRNMLDIASLGLILLCSLLSVQPVTSAGSVALLKRVCTPALLRGSAEPCARACRLLCTAVR